MILKYKLLIFSVFLAITQQQDTTNLTSDMNTPYIAYILWATLLSGITILIIYDRRQNFLYLNHLRDSILGKWNALVLKVKSLKKPQQSVQKLGTQQQISTDKGTMGFMQSQKTYIEADIASIQQTSNTSSSLPDEFKQMTFEDELPRKSLKQVFDKKQKKQVKKSRSKLKNKVQIKKSQLQQNENEQSNSERVEDLQNSLDNSEG